MATTLAQVLRHFGSQYLSEHRLSTPQARAWRAIVACRTAALGGQQLVCADCGAPQWRWHSCRNRHCPQCQSRAREAWRSARLAELLNVPYSHLVFTLPHELNALAALHPRWAYDTLMQCTAATLNAFAANPRWLGGTGAYSLVLHTWTQDLRRHLHVHALMACGALQCHDEGNSRWVRPQRAPDFLFPVKALSKVFRGKFLQALMQAEQSGALPRDPAQTERQRHQRLVALRRHDWVVYAKTPMAGPAAVLDYLSRYTHRTAVGNERLAGIEGDAVCLRVRANDTGGKRVVQIAGDEFIGRLLQHVLPSGFKRIRHYGLLAPATKTSRMALARTLLGMPQPQRQATEDAQAFMRRVAALEINTCPIAAVGGCVWCNCCRRRQGPRRTVLLPVEGHHERGAATSTDEGRTVIARRWRWAIVRTGGCEPVCAHDQGRPSLLAGLTRTSRRAHLRGGQHTTSPSVGPFHCPNRRLKLTLPIHRRRKPRGHLARFSSTRFISRKGSSMLASHVVSRLINAVR